ncbi:transcription antiterminator BglG [Oribacterium sp. C9]|uniref:PRD domain-containing protein n=1 Tax=Oribacterium sp. C9 TaxID=1943579 RepID=UPI00098EC880|nr:PRD domain-containing protein [Oribacterium sp. C9]OON85186.1 transcription antiterminator BglG [Oribacterium sp. C9]
MYRVRKVLNHNAILALDNDELKTYLVLHKGIGFGAKISELLDVPEDASVYSLEKSTERGNAMNIINEVDPVCLEISDAVLDEAEKVFGKVDRNIVFPMADHLAFAIQRLKRDETIRNPLKDDIRLLFHMEYQVAETVVPILQQRTGLSINDDEVGFIALHVHSAIVSENVAQSLQTAQIVRNCISYIEEKTGQKIEVTSLGYNRMMNHIRYMVTRIETGEPLKMNLNDYMSVKYPDIFRLSEDICNQMSRLLRKDYQDAEIGYLAMHIARVIDAE